MSGNRNSKFHISAGYFYLPFIYFSHTVVITLGMVIDRKSRNRRLRVFGRALGVTTGIYLFMISIDYLSGLLDRWP